MKKSFYSGKLDVNKSAGVQSSRKAVAGAAIFNLGTQFRIIA